MSNLNYFLISCSWPYYEKVAESLEKTINSSPAVWTAHPSRLEELTRKFPNTKVLNAHDLTCADLSVVEDAIYPAPLSIDSLSPSWQEKYSFERAMVMDNLLHRSDFGGRYSHAELLDIVNDYFIAADSLIKKFSPKLIYFEVPPHTMYDLAIYYLALSNNIKTLMVYDTCVPAVSVFLTKFNDANGIYQLSKLQQSRYEEKKNLFSTYCENIKNTNPFYMSSVVEWNGLKRTKEAIKLAIITIRHIIKERIQKLIRDKLNNRVGGNLKRAGYSKKRGVLLKDETASQLDILKEYFINWNLESIYKKASHDFNINKIVDNENYVYIPLSMQIEMTTMPSAGRMFDQKAYIRMVCSALPNGWIPIVKENPKQFTNLTGAPSRDKRFYSDLKQMGVLFAPLDFPSSKLIAKSKAVIVTTGTAGFEAIVGYRKPVISFAYTWYSSLPGCRVIFSMDELNNTFEDLECERWKVEVKDVDSALAGLSEKCVYLWGEGATIEEKKWDMKSIISNISTCISLKLYENGRLGD